MSCSGTLLLIFVVLKLAGVVTWGWGWVLSPIWITLLFYVGLAMLDN